MKSILKKILGWIFVLWSEFFKAFKWVCSRFFSKAPKSSQEEEEELSYQILSPQDTELADQAFEKMRLSLYKWVYKERDEQQLWQSPILFTERGFLEDGRPYFFLKPKDQIGWLFERTSQGWVITRSSKITSQNTFMRPYDPWDIVTLYSPKRTESSIRVISQRLGDDIISFPIYEKRLVEELWEMIFPPGEEVDHISATKTIG